MKKLYTLAILATFAHAAIAAGPQKDAPATPVRAPVCASLTIGPDGSGVLVSCPAEDQVPTSASVTPSKEESSNGKKEVCAELTIGPDGSGVLVSCATTNELK
jgi:hypothetical protein